MPYFSNSKYPRPSIFNPLNMKWANNNDFYAYTAKYRVPYRSGATQTMIKTRRLRRRANSFQKKLMQAQPAKHYSNSSTTTLLYNNIYTCIPTAGITQGDSNSNRTGDYVHLAAIKIKGFFETATTDAGYSYRILIGYTGEEYNLPTVLQNTGLTSSELFITNTPANWIVNGQINPKAFTAIYDETIDLNSIIPGVKELKSYAFTVQLDKRFPYQSDGGIYGKNSNLAIIVLSSISGGVTGITSCGSTVLGYDLIFKDL